MSLCVLIDEDCVIITELNVCVFKLMLLYLLWYINNYLLMCKVLCKFISIHKIPKTIWNYTKIIFSLFLLRNETILYQSGFDNHIFFNCGEGLFTQRGLVRHFLLQNEWCLNVVIKELVTSLPLLFHRWIYVHLTLWHDTAIHEHRTQ